MAVHPGGTRAGILQESGFRFGAFLASGAVAQIHAFHFRWRLKPHEGKHCGHHVNGGQARI